MGGGVGGGWVMNILYHSNVVMGNWFQKGNVSLFSPLCHSLRCIYTACTCSSAPRAHR